MEKPNEEIAHIIIDIVSREEMTREYGCCLLPVDGCPLAAAAKTKTSQNKPRIRIHTDTEHEYTRAMTTRTSHAQ